ncbi:MAG TPA: hypothetical protein DCS43_16565, partial [Verrucomicrobia bacterium]|nr:hypothetical protein [Verrucomicrobiota bacterium]
IDQLDLVFAHPGGATLDLAVLAGPNGCGKTSVLEACLLGLNQDKLLQRKLPDQDFHIELHVDDEGETIRVVRTPGSHRIENSGGSNRPAHVAALSDRINTFFFSSWRSPKLVGSVGLSIRKGKRPAKNEINSLWRLKQHLVNLKASSAFEGAPVSLGRDADRIFTRVNEAWKLFYPERNDAFDARRAPAAPAVSKDALVEDISYDVYLLRPGCESGIALDDLSSGEIEIVGMVGTFLMETQPFDVVFIDEPELHLHPAWHRSILPALRQMAPNTQFICATHSQDILESLYSHQRFTILTENDPRVRAELSEGGIGR